MNLNENEYKDNFTKEGDKTNLNINKLEVDCITSNQNNFSIDEEGNLKVNSISLNNTNTDIDLIYPIGSIYMNVSNVNPNTLFGGTWEEFATGRALVGVDKNDNDFIKPEKTGGSKKMQRHNHSGITGNGQTNFIRIVGGVGTSFAHNHMPGYSTNEFQDLNNGDNFPGANHFHNFETSYTGEGNNGNLQPYITCYIWKRIA